MNGVRDIFGGKQYDIQANANDHLCYYPSIKEVC